MGVYKVNVSLSPDLVEEIDAAADELGLSRSGFIAEASARYLADVHNLSAEERRAKDIERGVASLARIGRRLPPGTDLLARLREDRERDTPPASSR
ncbi:MAG: ribbon-helix-helix protein, CopG family [Actinobacteria bacterium]|nr:MAG: ribbon-helix-helix protein, CopG family [Actinomycetota bacterium]